MQERQYEPQRLQQRRSFHSKLNVIAGVIRERDTTQFSRLLYRISRGKVAVYYENIGIKAGDAQRDPADFGKKQHESYAAFVLFYPEDFLS